MLINRASGDAGRFADKLTGAHFVASFAAQQRSKFIEYELHRLNNAQHGGQLQKKLQAILRHIQRATLIAWEIKVLLARAAVK
jgi:hypothetical protein